MQDTENFKKNIHEDYDIEEELGSGQFAVVRKIVEKETGDEFAAKYVRKKRTKASRNGMSREDIKREIEILRMVDNEKIIKVHDVYETDKEMILVMELLRGGELFDYISKKDYLTEEEAIDFTRQILQGLQHLHSRNVVHLDLKPENILLKNTRRKTIKLVDFGLARVVNENEQVREIMGTPEFVAPEVLNFDTISTATDMWALGVIAYILLSGASPFLGEDNQETFTNIIQVDYQFDEEYFAEISDEAKDFIRKLLVKNPRKRPTAHDCSRHTWVEEEVADKKKKQRRRTTQICTFNFKRFVARKRWKMSYNKIRAMNFIAKLGIKPPPGFITEIPPMNENNNELVEPEPGEQKLSSHKEHKKKESTINRKKHKQSNPSKASPAASEKKDSLTLKTMDIDIGEAESVHSEPTHENAANDVEKVLPVVQEPIDFGSMSLRQKRRFRRELRTDEIFKSKQDIDEKKAKTELDENVVNGVDVTEETPAMSLETKTETPDKPEEKTTVTSTMHIEQKPGTTPSGGILKKGKATRIPSTEDHYFVTLNAALLQQDDAFYHSNLQPTRQHGHGILKNSTSSQTKDVAKPSENKKVSEFTTLVQGNSNAKAMTHDSGFVVGLQVDKAVAHAHETDDKPEAQQVENETPRQVKDNADQSTGQGKLSPPPSTKPTSPQPRTYTPPPSWHRKSSRENLKPSQQALHSVSKVSLKANRFVSNDKKSISRPPNNTAPVKTSNVLGKSKLFQKESNRPEMYKTSGNTGAELKNLSCDIDLNDDSTRNGSVAVAKPHADNQTKLRADSQSNMSSESECKTRSNSLIKTCPGMNNATKSPGDKHANNEESKLSFVASRSRWNSKTNTEVLNGDVAIQNDASGNEKHEITTNAKEQLTSSSTHSITEVTFRPRGNSSEEKPSGFDIMLTVAPPIDPPNKPSTTNARFTASSSSLPDPRAGLSNGKLASLSTNDMTLFSHRTVASPTTDRHRAVQVPKYAPQRDFSKYLNHEPSKPVKTTALPSNTQNSSWQVKRNNPSATVHVPFKPVINLTTPDARPTSLAVKPAGAKATVAMPKGKKSAVTSIHYTPTRSFGFAKAGSQSEIIVKPLEPEEAPKLNKEDELRRLSGTSYGSDRSASSASSDELSFSNVPAEENELNRTGSNEQISGKMENHSGALSPRASPVLQTKWKATLVLPEGSEKVPSAKDRDFRISSKNVPRKNKFANTRSMWEGK